MSKYTAQIPVATKKITLDFTNVEADQEVAVMPAWLAKQLLTGLALEPASARSIIGSHVDSLRELMGQEEAIKKAVSIEVDRRKIHIVEGEVKTLGSYTAEVGLGRDHKVTVSFEVVAE